MSIPPRVLRSRSRSHTPYKKSVDNAKASPSQLKPLQKDPKDPELSPEKTFLPGSPSKRLKKKSYLEIIKEYLDNFDSVHANNPRSESNGNFTLVEDMKIIYEMAKDDQEQSHLSVFWKSLANGILNRNVESIRSRYKSYLRYLEKEDFDKILEHLKANSIEGYYLKFGPNEDNPKKKKLIEISSDVGQKQGSSSKQNLEKSRKSIRSNEEEKEGKTEKITTDKTTTEKVEKTEKKSGSKLQEKKQTLHLNQKDLKWIAHITKYQEILRNNNIPLINVLVNKRQIEEEVPEIDIENLIVKKDELGRWVIEEEGQSLVKHLDLALEKLKKQHGIEKEKLVEALMAVSGDINDLTAMLELPDEKAQEMYKWTADDDDILEKCTSPNEPLFLMLRRYKGDERLKKRLEFLNKNLPFSDDSWFGK